MAQLVRYEPNPFFHKEVEAELEFKEGVHATAEKIAKLIQALAPVHSGYYKAHVIALAEGVLADDPYYHWIEFGSVHNSPKAPMRRGFRAAGLHLIVHPKP